MDKSIHLAKTDLSIVVPFFNEEKNVKQLYLKLKKVLESLGRSYELIFIDDGSSDSTFDSMSELYESDISMHVIKMRKNFGQTAALAAGFDYSKGRIIISLDGDLQHDPEDIPKFLEKIEEGYDIVSGWRKNRIDPLLTRRLPSLVANKIISFLSSVKIHDFGTTFKAYRREVLENIDLYGEMHRFIPALASWMGILITEIPIQNVSRTSGKSHYNLSRIIKVIFDLITAKFLISYIGRPLQIFGLVGIFLFIPGFMIALITTIRFYFYNHPVGQGNLLLAALLMLMAVQFVGMGIFAEIGIRIYHDTKNRKVYVIREIKSRREAKYNIL